MKKKLNSILLVDDSEATNYLHQIIVEESGLTEHCITMDSGIAAIEYLSTKIDGKYPKPEALFLDINMPVMNGWEFLEVYFKLPLSQQAVVVVCMLTASLNPDDKERAEKLLGNNCFANKPLTEEKLEELIRFHFPDRF